MILALVGFVSGCRGAESPKALPSISVVNDRVAHPPVRREFESPEGNFVLAIETRNEWKSPSPMATLGRRQNGSVQPVWSRQLAQHFGPRAAVVSNAGQVLLVDEWINVNSRLALMLIGRDDQVVAIHAHKDVVAALGVPLATISQRARQGTWMSAAPMLSPDGSSVLIASGGTTLVVDLKDGRLAVQR